MKPFVIFSICVLVPFIQISAQPEVSREDYQRALSLRWENLENEKVFNLEVRPHWLPDSSGLWFLNHGRQGKYYEKIQFSPLQRGPLFDHGRFAEVLNQNFDLSVDADSLPIDRIEMIDQHKLQFSIKDETFELHLSDYSLAKVPEPSPASRFESESPDGKWIAFSRNHNLWIRSVESGQERQLSSAGRKNFEYASWYGWSDIIEGESDERPEHFSVQWSPDSKRIQTSICDLRSARKMYLLDWSVDTLYRPRLLGYYRGSPGDTSMVHMIPVVFDIENNREIRPDLPRLTHINSARLLWSEHGLHLYAYYWERGFQTMRLVEAGLSDGSVKEIYRDESETNVDTGPFRIRMLESQHKVLLTSERNGWNHLYLIDLGTAELRPVTNGPFVVKDILFVDETSEVIYFSAAGREPGRNPYFDHVYRIGFDGKDLKLLTLEDAHHEVHFSPDGRFFVDNYSTATQPTVSVLRRSEDGSTQMELCRADIEALLDTGWDFPEVFTATGRDGFSTIYGAFWKPSNFDSTRKYPVIDHSYTGPHTFTFPNSFSKALRRNNQALAELGFIVVMIDGMGTAGRSKKFHDWSYKKMGMNLTDHVLAIHQAGQRFSWLDTDRVGIFGHSAGGYDAARGLLEFPDFYKVGVASSADHDHRMEKAWWPEMYMGWPVDEAYERQSNITKAYNLKGKLLLVHGGIDENVNPSATFKLSEALVKADKPFDLLILPSQRHGYQGRHSKYFLKRRWNYFIEHLLGAEPIWDVDF